MEGKINFTQCSDTSGKKPHFKGYITIGDEVHEFAVWAAKNGNGWSGTYKPKRQFEAKAEPEPVKPAKIQDDLDDNSIPF